MNHIQGGLENVPGFAFSAIECGIRYPERLDYCLIVSEKPCNASGVFTTNKIQAAPVKLCRALIDRPVSAILINSTNANACTGEQGDLNSKTLTADIAEQLNLRDSVVLMASTGIIGRQLPLEKMMAAHARLISSLSAVNGALVSRAIMTTDTVPKQACVSFTTTRGEFRIAGTAKGAGMIAPDMATLLCFIITDAPIKKPGLDLIFRKCVGATLNAITIDGDMSTNDTAIILSPQSGSPLEKSGDLDNFEESLCDLLSRLSSMLIADGEGTTKSVKIIVKNAKSETDASMIARTIAESLLVKTAFFGNDPNWGRIAAAAGYSGADVEESRLSILFDDLPLLINGVPADYDVGRLVAIMRNNAFSVTVDIGLGSYSASMLTTDISVDYVKINAEYST
jgi:glutamate N-acetyltransferase/amino-acid N-acetyltransferase